MVSRIRIEGHGPDMQECLESLREVRKGLDHWSGLRLQTGHEIYERDTDEPEDGSFAWKGRLVLLADIS